MICKGCGRTIIEGKLVVYDLRTKRVIEIYEDYRYPPDVDTLEALKRELSLGPSQRLYWGEPYIKDRNGEFWHERCVGG